jgi:hypothetical protein
VHVESAYLLRCRSRWHSCRSGESANSSTTEGWPLCPSGSWTEVELNSVAADIHRSVCEQTRCSSQRMVLGAAGLHSVMHLRQSRIAPHRRVFSPASERHRRLPCMGPTRVLGRGRLPVEGCGLRLRLVRKWSPPSLCSDKV